MNPVWMLLSLLAGALALLVFVPSATLLLQVLMSLAPERRREASPWPSPRPRTVVLMPAHDEGAGIAAAIATVLPQLAPGDGLLVVADNCSDDTAAIAAVAGAQVVVRHDMARRGKGYALDFGVRSLRAHAPEVVVIVDADCHLGDGALDCLVRECARSGRPVQALYLMQSPPAASLRTRIAEFAWLVKNHARPLGWHRLGLPCLLMGTGMAFPWALLREAPLASGHIVEDMQLGLDLAARGAAPVFCPSARVTSSFPTQAAGLASQRTRWEHGHLGVIAQQAPRLALLALRRRSVALAAAVLDLCVPPLASLVLCIVFVLCLAALPALGAGADAPLLIAAVAAVMLCVAIGLAWWRFARSVVSLRELMSVPGYVFAKLPIYVRLLRARQVEWVRTHRDGGSS